VSPFFSSAHQDSIAAADLVAVIADHDDFSYVRGVVVDWERRGIDADNRGT
jgi:Fe-S cluster assembly iron-binding protein IscA